SAAGIEVWKCDPVSHLWSPMAPGPQLSDAGGWNKAEYYSTLQCADIDGDNCYEILARSAAGIIVFKLDKGTNVWGALPDGPGWSDAGSWNQPSYYSTIQCADIDGDGCAEILARGAEGIVAFKLDKATNGWRALANGPGWSDAGGWNHPSYYSTIRCADID